MATTITDKIYGVKYTTSGGYCFFLTEKDARKYAGEQGADKVFYAGEIKPNKNSSFRESFGLGEYRGEKFVYLGGIWV